MGIHGDSVSAPVPPIYVDVDIAVYSEDTILRTSYWFTNRYFVSCERTDDRILRVCFQPKETTEFSSVAGEFANALIDQRLRETIRFETAAIRETIVTQAFAEGDLDLTTLSDLPDTTKPAAD